METSWERVGGKKKQSIEKRLNRLARKIRTDQGHIRPSVKTKFMFAVMRQMQKHGWNEADVSYWRGKGWTEKKRPWKS